MARRILYKNDSLIVGTTSNPPVGYKFVGYYGPTYSQLDENGNVSSIGASGGGGLSTVIVDGLTIIGDGSLSNPLSSTGTFSKIKITDGAQNNYILISDSDGVASWTASLPGTSGTSGTSGTDGTSGTSGTSGTTGTSGTSGSSGLLSLTGTTNNGLITLNGSAPNGTVESNLTFDGSTLNVTGNLFVSGSFSVSGSASSISTNSLVVSDPIIALGHSQSGAPLLDEGLMFVRGTGATQAFIWDESEDTFALISTNDDHTVIGNVNISGYSSLRVAGLTTSTFKMTNGAFNGYLLKSDTSGNATWVDPTIYTSNIYNSNGSLDSDRDIYGYGNYLYFDTNSPGYTQSSIGSYIYLENTQAEMVAYSSTGSVFTQLRLLPTQIQSNGSFTVTSGVFDVGGTILYANVSTSRVGVNNSSPSYSLHILGTTSTTGFRMTNGSSQNYLLQSNSTGDATWTSPSSVLSLVYGVTGVGSVNYLPKWSSSSNLSTTSSVYDDGNNVGIGTTNSTHMLTIGKSGNAGGISLYGNTSGFVYIKSRASVTSWTASLPSNKGNISQFTYNNFGGELMLNDGEGNLYFGTTPSLYLQESYVFIGNTYSYAIGRTFSGDMRNDYTGAVTINQGVVSYSKIQNMTQKSVLGSTNVSGGVVTEIPLYNSYLTIGSASNALDNASNWTGATYTGPAITGTYQGQNYYNGSYFYTAVEDNLWIRLARV
jgi:hypothetical protein